MGDWCGLIVRHRSTETPELPNHHATGEKPLITAAKPRRDLPAHIDNAC
jgi:hypothetical protein